MSRAFLVLASALSLAACAAPRQATWDEPPPRAIEVLEERGIATMHFPRGIYLLARADRDGYYYRAPTGVMQHSFGGNLRREGGIFLARASGQLRGYVEWGGEQRKIGNFARGAHPVR